MRTTPINRVTYAYLSQGDSKENKVSFGNNTPSKAAELAQKAFKGIKEFPLNPEAVPARPIDVTNDSVVNDLTLTKRAFMGLTNFKFNNNK